MTQRFDIDVPRFYRHSGKVPPSALVGGLMTALATGVLLGAGYGFLGFALHLLPSGKWGFVLTLFLMWGVGSALGFIPAKVMQKGRARSAGALVAIAALSAAIAIYVAWTCYVYAVLRYNDLHPAFSTVARPSVLWRFIERINEKGFWSFGHTPPTGIFLTLIWLTEIGVLMITAMRRAVKIAQERVFCEACDIWGQRQSLMTVADKNLQPLCEDLTAGKIQALAETEVRPLGSSSWCEMVLEGCPKCGELQVVSIERTSITADKKGNVKKKITVPLRRLVVTSQQMDAILQRAAALAGPTGAEAAE